MIRQAVSLRRTGHEYLAVQFENLFKLRTPWIESRKTLKVSARGPLSPILPPRLEIRHRFFARC
jgi:hypothetical protein